LSLEWITDPVSEGAECGPDLQIAADPAFMDYYFDAERRLPERYLLPTVFDPATIRIREEESRILPLLRRSRDIRLLALLARFQILAGKAKGFADSVEAIAHLLKIRPESAIPTTGNGNRARYDALETLANTTWVVMPLRYLPLTGNPEVTLRRHQVASGKASARADEEDLSAPQILEQLRSAATRAVTVALFADVTRAAAALSDIADICASHNRAVDYSPTLDVLEDIQALIRQAFPDLQANATPPAPSAETAPPSASPVQRPPGASDIPAAADLASSGEVRATLAAAEAYLARHEPSSAALLLVTQARQLVGRPLVEALEALLPASAAKAAIDFGPSVGFRLSMDRMKALTGATFPPDGAAAGLTQRPDPLPPRLASRSEVASHIRAVELWYRRNEPASPIPILLARARGWLDKDFEAILAEVLPSAGAI
jgi:type VI secretion system protein ImpA